MTLQGAIQELYEMREDTSLPVYYALSLADVINTLRTDVAEVRHGEWVFKFYCGNMSGYDYGMNCSVCGKPTHRQFAEKMPPYCPNCGAKMDEVENE